MGSVMISLPTSSLLLFKGADIIQDENNQSIPEFLFIISEIEIVTPDIKASRVNSYKAHQHVYMFVC